MTDRTRRFELLPFYERIVVRLYCDLMIKLDRLIRSTFRHLANPDLLYGVSMFVDATIVVGF